MVGLLRQAPGNLVSQGRQTEGCEWVAGDVRDPVWEARWCRTLLSLLGVPLRSSCPRR